MAGTRPSGPVVTLDRGDAAAGAGHPRRRLLVGHAGVLGAVVEAVAAVVLVAAVLAAVHHAEVVAHRVGEPFGSLVLAVAVTVIEVALIVTLMTPAARTPLAGPRHGVRRGDDHLQRHRRPVPAGRRAAQRRNAVVQRRGHRRRAGHGRPRWPPSAWCCRPSPPASRARSSRRPQLAFAAVASLVLYGLFVVTQTVRHRDYFLPVDADSGVVDATTTRTSSRPPPAPR